MTISVNSNPGVSGTFLRDSYPTTNGIAHLFEVPVLWIQPRTKGQWLDSNGNPTRNGLVILADGRKARYYCGSPETLASLSIISEDDFAARLTARRSAPGQYGHENWDIPKGQI